MALEAVLAFCVGVFAIFVGGIILIVRTMIGRLMREHEKELRRAYARGYEQGWRTALEDPDAGNR